MSLDATVGGPSSNSYITVAEADGYAAERAHSTAWTGTTATKEALLITATRLVNSLCYLGSAASSTQALKWPRSGLVTSTGFTLLSTILPLELKLATFEMALMLAPSDISLESDASIQGISRLKASSVEIEFRDGFTIKTVTDNVKQLLVSTWLCPKPKSLVIQTL